MKNIDIYKRDYACTGCGACSSICPKKAITLTPNAAGFVYPNINLKKCIDCGLCQKVCDKSQDVLTFPLACYATCLKDKKELMSTSSGGIATALANSILKENGIVYGCVQEKIDHEFVTCHKRISSLDDIELLKGSKYVKSDTSLIFKQVREDLVCKKNVLFIGTPCQIAGLKRFLCGRIYNNLFTVDIICHGTPSAQFFNDFVHYREKKFKNDLLEINFRDKSLDGWGLKVTETIKTPNGIYKRKILNALNTYYSLFLDGVIYRESCYSCSYAKKGRVSDMTIGDYWGIELEHPQFVKNNPWVSSLGCSCVLVNTLNGMRLFNQISNAVISENTTYFQISQHNNQIKFPTPCTPAHKEFLDLYTTEGYKAVEKWYMKNLGYKRYIYQLWILLPKPIQDFLKFLKKG